jgi:hypothetical protein
VYKASLVLQADEVYEKPSFKRKTFPFLSFFFGGGLDNQKMMLVRDKKKLNGCGVSWCCG